MVEYSVTMEPVGTNVEANLLNAEVWKRQLPQVLAQIGFLAQKKIQDKINAVQWKSSRGRMMQAVKTTVDVNSLSVTIWSDPNIAAHTVYHELGVKPQPMTWLVGKTIPFIMTGGAFQFAGRGSDHYLKGGTKFAKVTAESLAKGKWHHPGLKAHHFYRDGMVETVQEVQQHMKALIFQVATSVG